MTVKEFYDSIGSRYEDVIGSLLSDERIMKYLGKFNACDDVNILKAQLEEENWEEAFRSVHSLKGMCLNLSLSSLAIASSNLCEELRHGKPEIDVWPLYESVVKEYELVHEGINKLLQ